MHDIYENRIRFATHNVLCNPNMYNVGYMADVSMCLAEGGSSAQHRAEIKGINNDGALTIELPTIDLTVGWGNDRGPRMAEYPELILGTAMLSTGVFIRALCRAHCKRSESFLPIWQAFYQAGIKVGKKRRQAAEKAYFAAYDLAVAEANRQRSLHRQLQA
jgi:hypothetical protein